MNKASGSDGISIELFQILKDDAVKVLHSVCQQIWKTQQWPQDWKRSVSFQFQRKAMPRNAQTTAQLHSSHMLAGSCSKSFKLGFSSVNQELPDVQAGFTKGRGTRDQIVNIHWIIEKVREVQKKSTSALLTTPNPLTVWITTNCRKF